MGKSEKPVSKKSKSVLRSIGKVAVRSLSILFAVLVVVIVALLTTMWVLAKGPSPTAQRLFVLSVKETSAVGFLANIYLSEDEIDGIMNPPATEDSFIEATDTTLITPPSARPVQPASPVEDQEEQEDEDEAEIDFDEIELHEIYGSGYRGYMLVVRDPKRIFVGTPSTLGGAGMTLMNMVSRTGAAAGINAGGFEDPNGVSLGGVPDGIVISDGVLRWGAGAGYVNVIGFDGDGILHVGTMTPTAAMNLGLQCAVSFGPTLISNGVVQTRGTLTSGINPRTAIGQRADGAVLLLVVDGRQIDSLGATLEDLIGIFLDFGAVNAANLDGGSSTLMMLDGEIVNICAAVTGPRLIPTAFLVREAG